MLRHLLSNFNILNLNVEMNMVKLYLCQHDGIKDLESIISASDSKIMKLQSNHDMGRGAELL